MTRASLIILGLVVLLAQVGVARAVTPQEESASKQAEVLGPGDEIAIHVVDLDEIPDKPIRIDPNGFIDLPLAGRVKAAELTLDALKQELASKLAKYIDHPRISINLTESQSRPVSVIGSVNNPGVHQLQGPRRLIEVISLAGGVRPDAGANVVLTRQAKWGVLPLSGVRTDNSGGFNTATLKLDALLDSKMPADNILILPNDVISIPKADLVYVVGDVKRSGGFQLSTHSSMTVLQALSLSEGFGPNASPQGAKIMRPTGPDVKTMDEIPVDLKKIFQGKSPDVALYANDILFIPNSVAKSSARRVAEALLQAGTTVAIYAH